MFIKIGPEFQCWKDNIRIPMFIKIGPEFHSLEGEDQKSNVLKNKIIVPVTRGIRAQAQCLQQ